MLKAVKESLKNWLATHERLYWYIVVGLAVLGFGIITAIGCGKLERANAAQETSITVPWYGNDVTVDISGYKYYIVVYGTGKTGDTKVALCNSPMIYTGTFIKASDGSNVRMLGMLDKGDINSSGMNGTSHSCVSGKYSSMRANHDVYNESGALVLSANPFATVYEESYRGNLYTDIWHFVKNEPSNVSYSDRKVAVLFDIAGAVPEYAVQNPNDSFKIDTTLTYYLPHPDYVRGWILNGKNPQELLIPATRKEFESVYTVEKSGVACTVDLAVAVTYEFIEGLLEHETRFRVDILESDIYDGTASATGVNWQTYYGLSDAEWALYKDVIFGYTIFSKMSTVLYAKDSASSYVYGGLYTVSVLTKDNFLDTYIDKNPLDITDAEKSQAEADRLNELLGVQGGTIDDLKQQIKDMQDTQNAMGGELQGTDLWSSFSSLTNGLSGLGPSVIGIATLVGSVLSFVPAPVTNIMSFTLMALCIIALIKAVRG